MTAEGSGSPDPLVVTTRTLVAGGAAIATAPDGRVVLVDGALPAERVVVSEPMARRRMVRGGIASLLEASPHRVQPPCPSVAAGCGGCDLQYASARQLPHMKVAVVADALRHLGGLRDPEVVVGTELTPWGFRTTARVVADDRGRAGFRRRRSHEAVVPDACLIVHPLVGDLMAQGRFPPGSASVLRASAASGDRLVVVDADPELVTVPPGVSVVGREQTRGRGWLDEYVADRWWRVSGTSFFQSRPDGATALAADVASAVLEAASRGVDLTGTLVDAYSGVGLFAGALRTAGWRGPMVAIEGDTSAAADARVNLGDDEVEVVEGSVESWVPVPADLVIADPARSGLGRAAVEVLAATGAGAIVLVSCDAASLGRDVGLLGAHGFAHQRSTVVDMFPHTHHIEAVSLLVR